METARLSLKSAAFAASIVWGASVLIVGIANLIWPDYGAAFLDLASSLYPGYDGMPNIGSVLIGTGYALVDGAIGGFLLALLYNFCAIRKP